MANLPSKPELTVRLRQYRIFIPMTPIPVLGAHFDHVADARL
jgi:hypothetical protein